MKMMKKIKAYVHSSVVMKMVIGILFIVLIVSVWEWSLKVCSVRQPSIWDLYEIETSDFYG